MKLLCMMSDDLTAKCPWKSSKKEDSPWKKGYCEEFC